MNFMDHINKIILSIILIILTTIIAVGSTYLFLENKQEKLATSENSSAQVGHKPFTYGTIDNYFTGQERITYPLIFDNIRVDPDSDYRSMNFGPQNFEGFEISMQVSKLPRKDADNFKSMLINERGYSSKGSKTHRSGYMGELLSSDLKTYFDSNPQVDPHTFGVCSIVYRYFIPLADSNYDLKLEIYASQSGWEGDSDCIIYDDQNYTYLKGMIDHVIDNIQPAF